MFAVFKTGGKQYKVEVGDILPVELLNNEVGEKISFPEVLMISETKNSQVGTPFIKGAEVTAKVIKHTRGEKILIFKKRRRHNSRRLNGHKQHITLLKIEEINEQSSITEKNRKSNEKPSQQNKKDSVQSLENKSSESLKTKKATKKNNKTNTVKEDANNKKVIKKNKK